MILQLKISYKLTKQLKIASKEFSTFCIFLKLSCNPNVLHHGKLRFSTKVTEITEHN